VNTIAGLPIIGTASTPAELVALLEGIQSLGDYVRGCRRRLGLSLQEVASAVGISIPYLSELERGVKTGPPQLWRSIGAVLGCDEVVLRACYGREATRQALAEWQRASTGQYRGVRRKVSSIR
jgi:DNA-binding XRE family transcriptional regulator